VEIVDILSPDMCMCAASVLWRLSVVLDLAPEIQGKIGNNMTYIT
jgi:hypothetical protein